MRTFHRYVVAFHKGANRWLKNKVLEPKTYEYIAELRVEMFQHRYGIIVVIERRGFGEVFIALPRTNVYALYFIHWSTWTLILGGKYRQFMQVVGPPIETCTSVYCLVGRLSIFVILFSELPTFSHWRRKRACRRMIHDVYAPSSPSWRSHRRPELDWPNQDSSRLFRNLNDICWDNICPKLLLYVYIYIIEFWMNEVYCTFS